MAPDEYVAAYLMHESLLARPDLTPAARDLLRDDIAMRPERHATTAHARALVSYARTHARLMAELDELEDASDKEFERGRAALFNRTRHELMEIGEGDRLCIDARLVAILLADAGIDSVIGDLLKLEREVERSLRDGVEGFDALSARYWSETVPTDEERVGAEERRAAELGRSHPVVVGWLHTLEALSRLCMESARYRAAAGYARRVMRAPGYPNHAEGTVLLALARLDDEQGIFELSHRLGRGSEHAGTDASAQGDADGGGELDRMRPEAVTDRESSPWYLFARTILLYKTGKRKPARRALRDFTERCEGGAFFLLNPTYMTPYLPVRPKPQDSWDLSHQAVWEADGIISDMPDFTSWAESVEGVTEISDAFADRNGF